MKILAILQNQWFLDPAQVRAIMARATPAHRRRLTAFFLFRGCRTGVLLKQIFGVERCQRIVWDNASPLIGGHANSIFPADFAHINASIEQVKPNIVLGFGKVASEALRDPRCIMLADYALTGPHPVARQADALVKLRAMAARLDELERQKEPA